ncbi:MAG: aldo/keto reductase [Acidobacteriaceae bacterium]
MKRREFIKTAAATAAASAIASKTGFAESKDGIAYRVLGHTGERLSMVGIGGYHLARPDVSEATGIQIVRTALDNGINFLDNAWDYNGGDSEVRMGKALRDGYRQKAFLMTKLDGRTKEAAAQQIDESLHRLQTDHIDLMQIHEIIRMNDPERVFAPGGCMEALLAAKKAGKIRYIGFTGHKSPEMHLHMLNVAFQHNFTFDSVQMPLNVMDAHFDSFQKLVLPVLEKHNIGALGMKPMGDKIILQSNTATPVECLQYAMNLPVTTVITGCDSMKILDQALNTARNFKPLSQTEVAAILAKTAVVARNGEFEQYKTTHNFDGTYHNPSWLG